MVKIAVKNNKQFVGSNATRHSLL